MKLTEVPTRLAMLLVRGWQLGPRRVLPPMCRYRPGCSAYMLRALQLHGLARGGWMGLKRIVRCHPWREGGFDPVPGDDDPAVHRDYEKALLRQLDD